MLVRLLVLSVIIGLIDLYFFQAVKTVSQVLTISQRNLLYGLYWSVVAFEVSFGYVYLFLPAEGYKWFKLYAASTIFVLVASKAIGVLSLLADDAGRLLMYLWSLANPESADAKPGGMARITFLSKLAIITAGIPIGIFGYGMLRGAFNFTIRNQKISVNGLPEEFVGLRIVQISDIHIGSFVTREPLKRAASMIVDLAPDLVLFTGDLVNNKADEIIGYEDILNSIQAPMGVYSVFGNHDYGDYVQWNSQKEKMENLERLKKVQADAGWKLLLNEHVILEKDGAKLALIGVENWSSKMRFPRYGQLDKATKGMEDTPLKLLMSHDPSHWNAEVTSAYKDIDITFSGHTHGMQFGVEIPGIQWSPVQYVYKQWAGLYSEYKQHLYVNRGLGVVGFMGRVGMPPEITVIELERA